MNIDEMRQTVREGINLIDSQQKVIEEQRAYIERLESQVDDLKRQVGKLNLLSDLKADVTELRGNPGLSRPWA
jgi:archaellum component FlaC